MPRGVYERKSTVKRVQTLVSQPRPSDKMTRRMPGEPVGASILERRKAEAEAAKVVSLPPVKQLRRGKKDTIGDGTRGDLKLAEILEALTKMHARETYGAPMAYRVLHMDILRRVVVAIAGLY